MVYVGMHFLTCSLFYVFALQFYNYLCIYKELYENQIYVYLIDNYNTYALKQPQLLTGPIVFHLKVSIR